LLSILVALRPHIFVCETEKIHDLRAGRRLPKGRLDEMVLLEINEFTFVVRTSQDQDEPGCFPPVCNPRR